MGYLIAFMAGAMTYALIDWLTAVTSEAFERRIKETDDD